MDERSLGNRHGWPNLAGPPRPASSLTLAGTGFLAAALAAWFAFVVPMNAEMLATWSPESMPPDSTRVRDQWETAHAGRFVLQLIGLGALLLSVLAETPAGGSAGSATGRLHERVGVA